MIHYLANFIFTFTLLCMVSLNLQAEVKPNLVLLPMDVSEQEVNYESEYGSALQQGLQQRYTVFYGAAVEKELEKEYSKLNCDAETCNQNVAIAFNGELIADSSVKAINGGYILKLVIRNVISGEIIETETLPCRGCDAFSVISRLKEIGAGTLNKINNTSSAAQSATMRINGQTTPKASDARAILIFDSQPTGAAITINGQASGKTPYQGLNHKIGDQLRIELKDSRYRTYELDVSLNQAVTLLEPLVLETGQGQVIIVTEPYQANAVVYIDERAQGAAPLQFNLSSGKHEMYAQAGNKKTAAKTLTLNDGESKQVILEFASKPSLLKKLGIDMVDIPAGSFMMGSSDGDDDEKPVHSVVLSGFQLGKHEVTQGQWQAVMGNNPSNFQNCGANCPVEKVSWDAIQIFLKKLNQQTGYRYRLPTEAEWEYACRSGGKNQTYCGGNDADSLAWYPSNSKRKTHPVGQKRANGFGLYDMSGNVFEWVQDWKGAYSSGQVTAPTGPSSGSYRVYRGGSWYSYITYSRSVNRDDNTPDFRRNYLGFRLAR